MLKGCPERTNESSPSAPGLFSCDSGGGKEWPAMDGIYHELARKIDPAKLLGYLNFSDGRPDPKFQKGLADAVGRSPPTR